jgi:N-acetylmuramoyl-L-alanine amidase
MFQGLILVLGLLFFHAAFSDEKISLDELKLMDHDNKVTAVFAFAKKPSYHCFLLENPDRFVIDLMQVSIKAPPALTAKSFIKNIRSSDHQDYLRLVFDLNQKISYQTDYSEGEHQLKLTFNPSKAQSFLKEQTPQNKELNSNLSLPSEPPVNEPQKTKAKNFVIVIDPGHGGKDPGAAGPHGILEKDIVLKISKQLQAMLNEEPGFRALLTRSTDYYLPLRKRLAIARKNNADLFIAIHADAYHHCHATGASVYALSQRGATSEAARWLAEKENESELGGLSDELADKDVILRSVLIDLSQTHTIESSLRVGNNLLHNLAKFAPLHHPSVEQAAFVVLKSPDIPSVLVETGFLSNPSEEDKLKSPEYQHQTALAIKEGIKEYFSIQRQAGSWFSEKKTKIKEIAVNETAKHPKADSKIKKKHPTQQG